MTFEEIKQIETGPDYNLYLKRIEGLYYGAADIGLYYHTVLTSLYLKKFDEKYGTNMCPEERLTKLCCYEEHCEDMLFEEIYAYEYDALDAFLRVAETYKFETHIYILDENMEFPEGEDSDKVVIKEVLKGCEKVDDAWKDIVQECAEILAAYFFGLEEGTIVLLRNREIGLYKEICLRYKDFLNVHMKAEMKEIEKAIDELEFPLLCYNISECGYVDKYYYICVTSGFDGCGSTSFALLNISWLIYCFVLNQLLLDFRKKLAKLLADERSMR